MARRMFISAPFRALTLASVLALCSPFVTSAPALAQGVPVVDTQNIAQNIVCAACVPLRFPERLC